MLRGSKSKKGKSKESSSSTQEPVGLFLHLPFHKTAEKSSSCGSRGRTKLQNKPHCHNLNVVKRGKKKKLKPGRFNCIYPQVGCKRYHRDRYESAEPSAQEKCFSRETSVILTRTRWASQLAAACMLFIKQQRRQRQALHRPLPPWALHLFSCLGWPDTLKFKWVFFSSSFSLRKCLRAFTLPWFILGKY